MFRKELFVLGILAALIFAVVTAASFSVSAMFQRESFLIARDTFPGLVNTGTAIARINDNWNNNKRLLEVSSAQERSRIIEGIQDNSTANLWKEYQKSIYDPQDRLLYNKTIETRKLYLALCGEYYRLLDERKTQEAPLFLTEKIEPVLKAYKSETISLFQLNQHIGEGRARQIVLMTHWLPWVIAIFAILVFGLGVLVGLKGAFGSLTLVSESKKAQPTKSKSTLISSSKTI